MKDTLQTEHTTNITNLNEELVHKLNTYLPLKDRQSFARTNKLFNSIWYKQDRRNSMFIRLQQAILDNEQEKVTGLLDIEPTLLLEPGAKISTKSAIVKSKLTLQRFLLNKTPLQIALIRNQVEMVEWILPYFDKLENGQAEALKQWNSAEETILKQRKNTQKYVDGMLKTMRLMQLNQDGAFNFKDQPHKEIQAESQKFIEIMLPHHGINLDKYINAEALLKQVYPVYINEKFDYTALCPEHKSVISFGGRAICLLISRINFLHSILNPELIQIYCDKCLMTSPHATTPLPPDDFIYAPFSPLHISNTNLSPTKCLEYLLPYLKIRQERLAILQDKLEESVNPTDPWRAAYRVISPNARTESAMHLSIRRIHGEQRTELLCRRTDREYNAADFLKP